MAEQLIWSDDKSMNFIAAEYLAARITYPRYPADEGRHWVRVHLKGSTLEEVGHSTGLRYATCNSEQEAKRCLVQLEEKLKRAGVIGTTESKNSNRFDHVDIAGDTA